MISLGYISFLSPWLLLALLALPVLWWLLRVTPPAPKQKYFPAIRLLFGLNATEQTSSDAPWWLILIRLMAVAFVIIALAHPLLNDSRKLDGRGPLVLVVDNGWSSAKGWQQRLDALEGYLDLAAREGRTVIATTTATAQSDDGDLEALRMTAQEATAWLKGLVPYPWPADGPAAIERLKDVIQDGPAQVVWAGTGLDEDLAEVPLEDLQRWGSLQILTPETDRLPVFLKVNRKASGTPEAVVSRVSDRLPLQLVLLARAEDGRVLLRQDLVLSPGEKEASTNLDLPQAIENEISLIEIEGERHAGAVYLLDNLWDRISAGLVQNVAAGSSLTLLSDHYYLTRALDPVAEISQAPIDILLRSGQGMIILPDNIPLEEQQRGEVNEWVREGGVLVRFAGPRLARQPEADLLPVKLRQGGRVQDGAMQWGKPALLGGFSEEGPFAGLPVSEEVSVSRQVLAEPGPELEESSWAHLDDGTPLVTGLRRGRGWIVLFHTTANADWSNLALSGLFVEMLDRLGRLANGSQTALGEEITLLPPLKNLDAFGNLIGPLKTARAFSTALPEAAEGTDETEQVTQISSVSPPGLYGTEAFGRALNLMDHVEPPQLLSQLPAGVTLAGYISEAGLDLRNGFLVAALLLFLADAWLSLMLRGQLMPGRADALILALAVGFGTLGVLAPDPAQAQSTEEIEVEVPAYADETLSPRDRYALAAVHGTALAYVVTGNDRVDQISREGLAGLGLVLNQRTAVEASQPVGVNVEKDDLSFFPLLYWPMTPEQAPLSRTAMENLNQFMAAGGTILIDTRTQSSNSMIGDERSILRRLTRGLDIPPLNRVGEGHVLTKSFYLLQEFPGRWQDGGLWVEPVGRGANDGVSRLVIGNGDWAAAWAMDAYGRPRYAVVPGGERQREMSYRFGVNLVMYMLTGNYKADQVHVPAILERLGQ